MFYTLTVSHTEEARTEKFFVFVLKFPLRQHKIMFNATKKPSVDYNSLTCYNIKCSCETDTHSERFSKGEYSKISKQNLKSSKNQ